MYSASLFILLLWKKGTVGRAKDDCSWRYGLYADSILVRSTAVIGTGGRVTAKMLRPFDVLLTGRRYLYGCFMCHSCLHKHCIWRREEFNSRFFLFWYRFTA